MEAKNLEQNSMPHIVYVSNDSSMKLFFYGITANLENHRHAWLLCFNEKKFATSEPLKKVGLLECRSVYKRNSKLFVIVWLPSRNQLKMSINSGNWHVDLDQT